MKKLSLSRLSKINLTKSQEKAILGGEGSCTCSYVCKSCFCGGYSGYIAVETMAIGTAEDAKSVSAGVYAK